MSKEYMYVGCFTDVNRAGTGEGGIGVFEREGHEEWKLKQICPQVNPSFICFDENKTHIYAVQGAGYNIHSYRINGDGTLSYLNCCEGLPSNFCQVVRGQLYVSGREVEIYDLNDDGSLKERVISFLPEGEIGPRKPKQHSINPHQIIFDPAKEHFALPCHGADFVAIFDYDRKTNTPKEVSRMPVLQAMMPRHIAFHPYRPLAYLLLEEVGMVMSLKYENGVLTPFQNQLTVPDDFVGLNNTTAEIAVHPNGKYLALSNRGHDSILICRICDDGRLEKIKWYKDENLIALSRFFTFDEKGEYLYCANIGRQNRDDLYGSEFSAIPNTGDISIFRFDAKTGEMEFTGEKITYPAPSCILFK